MKLISILVLVSQSLRSLATKARNKAIISIRKGLQDVEAQLQDVEGRRSEHMQAAHQKFYTTKAGLDAAYEKELAALKAKYEAKHASNKAGFEEKRKVIALVAKGAVQELVVVRTRLRVELDHLTK